VEGFQGSIYGSVWRFSAIFAVKLERRGGGDGGEVEERWSVLRRGN
jgi:hypothetical protein